MDTRTIDERGRRIRDLERMATILRRHSIRMTSEAGSGHPTTALSAADLVAALFFGVLRYDVKEPENPDNDRFILSKGHGCPILYAALAEAGAFPVEHLLTLRRIDSDLEGHPTPRLPWIDVATGSLGQGLSAGVGMALAARLDRRDYRVFVLMGDGETTEGSVWEAAAVAAHYRLDNLVGIVDVNRLGQSAPTPLQHDLASYARRFGAFGWRTVEIDGHDFGEILAAFDEAVDGGGAPVMILAKTIKGKGVSFLADQEGRHGKALAEDGEMERALAELSVEGERPHLQVRAPARRNGRAAEARSGSAEARMAPPDHSPGDEVATRTAYGTALKKLGDVDPRVVAIDGDVKDSTRAKAFADAHSDRFVEGYIAEQNMVGMAVGLQARGKVPFVATFAAFLSRAYDIVRMAGVSQANVKLCGSHAGTSIGRDGPSQMGLEDLAMMRAIPRSVVLYPADAVSTERLVELAARLPGIVYLRTTRPKTPVLYPNDERFEVGGCKVLRQSPRDRLTVVGAGITVHEILEAHRRLDEEGLSIRVVDAYSVKPIDRDALLRSAADTGRSILTVEDHYAEGGLGAAVAAAVAPEGVSVHRLAVRELPRSGAPNRLFEKYGIGARAIVEAARSLAGGAARRVAAR